MDQAERVWTEVEVLAPMQGWVWPLHRVPDPAFATGGLGPGLAIDPLDPMVSAPVSGLVTTFHPSHHAIVIRHDSGIEVLVHVGIDTVELAGQGFTPRVAVGQRVEAGEPLMLCDLDLVVRRGLCLASPVVVIAPDGVTLRALSGQGRILRGAPLFVVEQTGKSASQTASPDLEVTQTVTIGLPHGIHARPAAAMARLLREAGLSGRLSAGDRQADLASTVALMRGGFVKGEAVSVAVAGADAAAVLEQVVAILGGQFIEAEAHVPASIAGTCGDAVCDGRLRGLTGSPGLAVGPAFWHRPPEFAVAEAGQGEAAERAALAAALAAVESDLEKAGGSGALGQVMAAHRELLTDPELRDLAETGIAGGQSAAFAWRAAIASVSMLFEGGDARLAERRADLADLGRRVLGHLCAEPPGRAEVPAGALVLADDLLPSELADYAANGIAGVALAGSSPTAHVAIIAAGQALPLLVAVGAGIRQVGDGDELVLDARAGILERQPESRRIAHVRSEMARLAAQAEADHAAAGQAAVTLDGLPVPVMANLGGLDDARAAVESGADGCGLLRTEFLFMNRSVPPEAAEQQSVYHAIRDILGDRPLTIRTLDVGGDKPVAFLPARHEENPALGLRGLRVGLAHPELLDAQLRAVIAATRQDEGGAVNLMVPMVAGLNEWRAVRGAFDRLGGGDSVKLGLMIETPAAVLLADQLAAEADFLSIGTNDLTQYVLAMDRTNPELAAAADPLHPAVLRAIRQVCALAGPGHCPVSVCGSLAGDPLGIPLLLGLGASSLSVVPAAVAATKRVVRHCNRGEWAELAMAACDLPGPREVRAFVQSHLPEGGLLP